MPPLKHFLPAAGLAASTLLAPSAAQAHGSPEYPIGRQYNCYLNRNLPACKAAIAYGGEQPVYDWNAVNQAAANGNPQAVVPDGKLCAGGNDHFKGFDLVRGDWAPTAWAKNGNNQYEFRYFASAPHRALFWKFYLTRQGWQPGASALKWSDLELVATVSPDQITTTPTNRYVMQLSLPYRTGQHILYSYWQRSDSQEGFFNCSDVAFDGSVVPPSTNLQQLGQVSAAQDLAAGTTVKLRVFGPGGADLESQVLTINAGNGAKATWLAQLASQVNLNSPYVRVGTLQNGSVNVPAGATVMQVYAVAGKQASGYALDIGPQTTPPGTGGDTWAEGQSYKVGQVVKYQGVNYVCLQAHTAWAGAGWYPSAPGVLNILWKQQQ